MLELKSLENKLEKDLKFLREQLDEVISKKRDSEYTIPKTKMDKVFDVLKDLYENSKKNPITLAKAIDLVITDLLDYILEDMISTKDLSDINEKEEDSETKQKKIKGAKEFIDIFINTLSKSLKIYKSQLG